ncbi:MAG TPA: glycoside hydrolase family 3 C-terminal domain-containing protein [Acidimicrobiales bacterium]|nr:glycoside hydrolase family 3 C-terminal domain-containing protein [Acidimicrobiales bacterium]
MADIDKLVAEMTPEEKASLTAGRDMWSTNGVPRLGIPPVRVTDGPNGARGTAMGSAGPRSVCVPCGSALGATWDPDLLGRIGELLGREARRKSARVLLAPTVNIHRSPLAGRNFECYSEDPHLSGRLAAAFVRGAQSQGVATTVKHLVANDAEFERHTISSVVDERALREIYLLPFEMAVRDGGALGVMTSYNRLNGRYNTRRRDLLQGILRDEWGFEGFVLTDWYGAADTEESARAGLDLEMPGPGRAFGPALAAAVAAGRVDPADLDGAARRLLSVFDRLGALDDAGDGPEEAIDDPADRALAREAATGAAVLLANDGLLPLDPAGTGSVALIGPHAVRPRAMGGGSSAVRPHHRANLLESLGAALGTGVHLVHEPGCGIDRGVPTLKAEVLRTPGGDAGMELEVFAGPDLTGPAVHREVAGETKFFSIGSPAAGVPDEGFSLRAIARYRPEHGGPHRFSLLQAGRARLTVGGRVVIDGFADPPPRGDAFFGLGSQEVDAAVDLAAGTEVEIVVEYSAEGAPAVHAWTIGCARPLPADLMERAEAVAAAADVAVVVVGNDDDWETEGQDRTSLDLPGRQDELVERVAAANPNTVVVVNAGAPVALPWADRVRAVLWCWFGGQELDGALADVLVGKSDPAGRLPFTLPLRLEHNPSYGNFPGENGEVRYGEGVLVGYRWYEARDLPVAHPFGHGLSYSTFSIGAPRLSSPTADAGHTLIVDVPVTNTGDRRGAEVVQLYVRPLDARAFRPPQELKAFRKVWVDPGQTVTASLELDGRAWARWDPGQPWLADAGAGWRVDPGRYLLAVGRSSADIAHEVVVEVAGE